MTLTLFAFINPAAAGSKKEKNFQKFMYAQADAQGLAARENAGGGRRGGKYGEKRAKGDAKKAMPGSAKKGTARQKNSRKMHSVSGKNMVHFCYEQRFIFMYRKDGKGYASKALF